MKIVNFLHKLPVRKKVFNSKSTSVLEEIRQLLKAYSLTHPSIRFSVRTLNSKHYKLEWTYAPAVGNKTSLLDAAMKVIGTECATHYVFVSERDEDGREIEALFPKPDINPEGLSSHGSFVSVDRRPLDKGKGIAKAITKRFRSTLREMGGGYGTIREPFFAMNMFCLDNSYDFNIEPNKDDVKFTDEDKFLGFVDGVLKSIYSKKAQKSPTETIPEQLNRQPTNLDEILECSDKNIGKSFVQGRGAWHPNMNWEDHDEEVTAQLARDIADYTNVEEEEKEDQISRDVTIHNPWTLAKMNSSTRKDRPVNQSSPRLGLPFKKIIKSQVVSSPPMVDDALQVTSCSTRTQFKLGSSSPLIPDDPRQTSPGYTEMPFKLGSSSPLSGPDKLPSSRTCETLVEYFSTVRTPIKTQIGKSVIQGHKFPERKGPNKPFVSPVIGHKPKSSKQKRQGTVNSKAKLRQGSLDAFSLSSKRPAASRPTRQGADLPQDIAEPRFQQVPQGSFDSGSLEHPERRSESPEIDPDFFIKRLRKAPAPANIAPLARHTEAVQLSACTQEIAILSRYTLETAYSDINAFVVPLSAGELNKWSQSIEGMFRRKGLDVTINNEDIERAVRETIKDLYTELCTEDKFAFGWPPLKHRACYQF